MRDAAPRIFIIAGEASGDLHGGHLAEAFRQISPQIKLQGWGGDHMSASGVDILKHYRALAFMGFSEVIRHLPTILRNFKRAKQSILTFKPDAIVLIDYPGFNLRMATWAKRQDIPVFYYISPQLWAWKENRIKIIQNSVQQLYVILPFEQEWYAQRGVSAKYVGHPLREIAAHYQEKSLELPSQSPIIALLPGSRSQEIAQLLPIMLEVADAMPQFQFVIGGAPGQSKEVYEKYLAKAKSKIPLLFGQTYDLLKSATAAIVTSGTATLETALFQVPQIVVYKGSELSYQIAKWLIKVQYISLVNLILDKPSIPELIQSACNKNTIISTLTPLLEGEKREQQLQEYSRLQSMLNEGNAAMEVAADVLDRIHKPH